MMANWHMLLLVALAILADARASYTKFGDTGHCRYQYQDIPESNLKTELAPYSVLSDPEQPTYAKCESACDNTEDCIGFSWNDVDYVPGAESNCRIHVKDKEVSFLNIDLVGISETWKCYRKDCESPSYRDLDALGNEEGCIECPLGNTLITKSGDSEATACRPSCGLGELCNPRCDTDNHQVALDGQCVCDVGAGRVSKVVSTDPDTDTDDNSIVSCALCADNTFSSTESLDECTACPVGAVADGTGNTQCICDTSSNFWGDADTNNCGCSAGFGFKDGECEQCAQGSYSLGSYGSRAACTQCANGMTTTSPEDSSPGATPPQNCFCPVGSFINNAGECEACPDGASSFARDSRACECTNPVEAWSRAAMQCVDAPEVSGFELVTLEEASTGPCRYYNGKGELKMLQSFGNSYATTATDCAAKCARDTCVGFSFATADDTPQTNCYLVQPSESKPGINAVDTTDPRPLHCYRKVCPEGKVRNSEGVCVCDELRGLQDDDSGTCICKTTEFWNGAACDTCLSGEKPNKDDGTADACVCDTEKHFQGDAGNCGCAAGFGGANCDQCAKGSYSPYVYSSRAACISCPQRMTTVSPDEDQAGAKSRDECFCPTGSFLDKWLRCRKCPEGSSSSARDSRACTCNTATDYWDANEEACKTCSKTGEIPNENGDGCVCDAANGYQGNSGNCGCKPGYGANQGGECVICGNDYFSIGSVSASTAAACEECPANEVTAKTGSTSAADCECPVGFFLDDSSDCVSCGEDATSAGSDARECSCTKSGGAWSKAAKQCVNAPEVSGYELVTSDKAKTGPCRYDDGEGTLTMLDTTALDFSTAAECAAQCTGACVAFSFGPVDGKDCHVAVPSESKPGINAVDTTDSRPLHCYRKVCPEGKVRNSEGVCVCDSRRGLQDDSSGGCICEATDEFWDGTGKSSCAACPFGKTPNTGKNACECDTSEHFVTAGDTCECEGGYGGFDCQQCPANTYSSGESRMACTACPKNMVTDGGGKSASSACFCPDNFFLDPHGNCLACALVGGTGSKGPNANACTCAQSDFWSGAACETCPSGEKPNTGQTACECDDTKSFEGISGHCGCKAGYGSKDLGVTCVECDKNTYSPSEFGSRAACTACPKNMETNGGGKSAITDCVCPVNFFLDPHGNCLKCGSDSVGGTGSDRPNADACTCGDGSFWDGSKCVACSGPGEVPNAKGDACVCDTENHFQGTAGSCGCQPGYGVLDPGTLTCTACVEGFYSVGSVVGPVACVQCAGAETTAGQGSSSADACFCPSGFFINSAGECTGCPAASTSSTMNAKRCTCTNTDTEYWDEASGMCKDCPAGEVPNANGDGCVCDTASNFQGTTGSCGCQPGYGGTSAQDGCAPCGANSFSIGSVVGVVECTSCPLNTVVAEPVGNAAGATSALACECPEHFFLNEYGECKTCGDSGTSTGENAKRCTCTNTDTEYWDEASGMCKTCSGIGEVPNTNGDGCVCDTDNHFIGTSGSCGCEAGYGGENCEICGGGFYSTGAVGSRAECQSCPAGEVTVFSGGQRDSSGGGMLGATSEEACKCRKGRYLDIRNVCQPCGDFGTSTTWDATACECDGDRYWDGGACVECADGETLSDGVCVCDTGNNFQGDAGNCGCAAGFGGPNCNQCAKGSYSPYVYSSRADCISCPQGMTTVRPDANIEVAGAKSRDECFCPKGSFLNHKLACKDCPEGSSSSARDSRACTCAASSEYWNADKEACEECPTGEIPNENGDGCVCDAANGYQGNSGNCGCKPGYGANQGGECVICGNDYFSIGSVSASTAAACEACPANEVTAKTGSTSAANCECPVGFYLDDSSDCVSCGEDATSAGSDARECSCTKSGEAWSRTAVRCVNAPEIEGYELVTSDEAITGACRYNSGTELGLVAQLNGQNVRGCATDCDGNSNCVGFTLGLEGQVSEYFCRLLAPLEASGSDNAPGINSIAANDKDGVHCYRKVCPEGKVRNSDGVCVCDSRRGLDDDNSGGCRCFSSTEFWDVTSPSASCAACPIGEKPDASQTACVCDTENNFVDNTDSSGCVCNEGYGGFDCQRCPANTFSSGGSRMACTACPKNMVTDGDGQIASSACFCPDNFFLDPHGNCLECRSVGGTGSKGRDAKACTCAQSDFWSGAACETCPSGEKPNAEQTACVCDDTKSFEGISGHCGCKAGYGSKDLGVTCVKCTENTYSPSEFGSRAACKACPSNMITTGTGASAITDCACPDNFFLDPHGKCLACASDSVGGTGSDGPNACTCESGSIWDGSKCVACSGPGEVPNANGDACVCDTDNHFVGNSGSCGCEAGYGGENCDVCVADTYSPYLYGSRAACTSCPANMETNGDGATSASACKCPSNFFLNAYGECKTCGSDTSTGPNAKRCTCNTATDYWDKASGTCKTCSGTGEVPNANGDGCVCDTAANFQGTWGSCGCQPGYGGEGECAPCGANSFSIGSVVGVVECTSCPLNTVVAEPVGGAAGATSALACKCPSDYFLNEYGDCLPCGAESSSDGSTRVAMSVGPDARACICEKNGGDFLQFWDGDSCKDCPPGEVPNANGDGCVCDTDNHFIGTSGSCGCEAGYGGENCDVCAADTYSPYLYGSRAACLSCPANMETNGDDATSASACKCPSNFFLNAFGECKTCGSDTSTGPNAKRCTCNTATDYWDKASGTCKTCSGTGEVPNANGDGCVCDDTRFFQGDSGWCGCMAGYGFVAGSGGSPATCSLCARGTYSIGLIKWLKACETCPANENTQEEGATSPGSCECPADHFLNDFNECTPCGQGATSTGPDARECTCTNAEEAWSRSAVRCVEAPEIEGYELLTSDEANTGACSYDSKFPLDVIQTIQGNGNNFDSCKDTCNSETKCVGFTVDSEDTVDEFLCRLLSADDPAAPGINSLLAADDRAVHCYRKPCAVGTVRNEHGTCECDALRGLTGDVDNCVCADSSKFWAGTERASCETCPEGEKPNGDQTGCVCDTDKNFQGSRGSCVCKPGFGGFGCVQCPANTYSTGGSRAACTDCPSRKIAAPGSDEEADCTCPAGHFLKDGDCVVCAGPGSSSVGPDATACTCSGSNDFWNGAACETCPLGEKPNADDGTANACVCDEAQHFTGESGRCGCMAGYGGYGCYECIKNTFSVAMDASRAPCGYCPPNMVTDGPGATSSGDCLCPPNHFLNGEACMPCVHSTSEGNNNVACSCSRQLEFWNGVSCEECPAGQVPNQAGDGCVCDADNHFVEETGGASGGQLSCVCEAGFGGQDCDQCIKDFYSVGNSLDRCAACPDNEVTEDVPLSIEAPGAVSASECFCPQNFFVDSSDNNACKACKDANSPGPDSPRCFCIRLNDFWNGAECEACPPGEIPNGDGDGCVCDEDNNFVGESGSCGCKAGFGGDECELCPANFYHEEGVGEPRKDCTPCPTNQVTLASGESDPGACFCPDNHYLEAGSCKKCVSGAVSTGPGAEGCICPSNSLTWLEATNTCGCDGATNFVGTAPDCTCKAGFGFQITEIGEVRSKSCLQCQPGTFSPGGKAECEPCPSNHYADVAEASECTVCAATQGLKSNPTATGCLCDHASGFEAGGDPQDCQCRPSFGYEYSAGIDVRQCVACEPGAASAGGKAPCIECTQKGAIANEDRTACLCDMDRGWGGLSANGCKCRAEDGFAEADDGSCVCAGGYSYEVDAEGAVTCRRCGPVLYSPGGKSICYLCNGPGTVLSSDQGSCGCKESEGFIGENGLCECNSALGLELIISTAECSCKSGFEPAEDVDGSKACRACEAGTASSDGQACAPCDAGTFSAAGASTCTSCSENEHWDGSRCVACDASEGLVPSEDQLNCVCNTAGGQLQGSSASCQCPPGYGAEENDGELTCKQCPPQTASPGGRDPCTECPAIQFAAAGAIECVECSEGQYWAGALCQDCGTGKISDGTTTACITCEAGTFKQGPNNCNPCAPGSVSPGNQDACEVCGSGKAANGDATECTPCDKGTYRDADSPEDTLACKPCPEGTFADVMGKTECTDIPAGHVSADGITTTPCGEGFEPNAKRTECVEATPTPGTSPTSPTGGDVVSLDEGCAGVDVNLVVARTPGFAAQASRVASHTDFLETLISRMDIGGSATVSFSSYSNTETMASSASDVAREDLSEQIDSFLATDFAAKSATGFDFRKITDDFSAAFAGKDSDTRLVMLVFTEDDPAHDLLDSKQGRKELCRIRKDQRAAMSESANIFCAVNNLNPLEDQTKRALKCLCDAIFQANPDDVTSKNGVSISSDLKADRMREFVCGVAAEQDKEKEICSGKKDTGPTKDKQKCSTAKRSHFGTLPSDHNVLLTYPKANICDWDPETETCTTKPEQARNWVP